MRSKKNKATFHCRIEVKGYTVMDFWVSVDTPDELTEEVTKDLIEKGFEQVQRFCYKE
jgi:hypothetical protein